MEARDLFKVLDRLLWKAAGHSSAKLLQQIEPYQLVAAAENPAFLKNYDSIMIDCHSAITVSVRVRIFL